MLYGLAREGMLPKIFAYIHPRFRTSVGGDFPGSGVSVHSVFYQRGHQFHYDLHFHGVRGMAVFLHYCTDRRYHSQKENAEYAPSV